MDNKFGFVYLRAKAILQNEKAARALEQDVYLQVAEMKDNNSAEEQEVLGRTVYRMGCEQFQDKKAREDKELFLWESELNVEQRGLTDEEKEDVANILEKLPTLYFPTFVAFYYDYMDIEEIADAMSCSEGTVYYRLNYARKCIEEILPEDIRFTPMLVRSVIYSWFAEQSEHTEELECARTITGRTQAEWASRVTFAPAETWVAPEMPEAPVEDAPIEIEEPAEELAEEPVEELVEEPTSKKKKRGKGILIFLVLLVLATGFGYGVGKVIKHLALNPSTEEKEQVEVPKENEPDEEVSIPSPQPENEEPEVTEPVAPVEPEYIFENSDKELLTNAQLEACSKEQLRLARNEIYARHGVIFGIEDLDTYFSSKSWYKPTMSLEKFYDTVEMNLTEEQNIVLIQNMEKKK